jgi:hypothetical protein
VKVCVPDSSKDFGLDRNFSFQLPLKINRDPSPTIVSSGESKGQRQEKKARALLTIYWTRVEAKKTDNGGRNKKGMLKTLL